MKDFDSWRHDLTLGPRINTEPNPARPLAATKVEDLSIAGEFYIGFKDFDVTHANISASFAAKRQLTSG